MLEFIHYTPTEIVFGRNAEENAAKLAKKHGGSRVMIVYGSGSAVKSGLLKKTETLLEKEGLDYISFGGVQPNPLLSLAREGVRRAIEFGADMILALGGGSVIDTGKAIAHGAANPGVDIWQFWKKESVPEKSLPIGVILTISAAGSETSYSAVITNDETGEKRGLIIDLNRPKFAVMNPELTLTLPPYQIACGIVDIIMHTLDRYFVKADHNELTTELAEAVLRVTVENGRRAMINPHDYDAMSELMWCGSVSHNGITGLGVNIDFAVHQLGHELSGMFDIAHGASLSIVWGAWAGYTYKENPERFARYAKNVWGVVDADDIETAALTGIKKTVEYFKSLGMPTCFSEAKMGVQSNQVLEEMALRCTFYKTRLVGQFKKLDQDDLYNIYTQANR
jgi:alcohol dehydrogenase YqhD (iron-dependent ADH family)